MHQLKSWLRMLALCTAATTAVVVQAQQTLDRPLEQTYRVIVPQPVETGERIEIIDFFWYG